MLSFSMWACASLVMVVGNFLETDRNEKMTECDFCYVMFFMF